MANVEDRTGEFVTLQQAAAALGVGPWNMPGLLAGGASRRIGCHSTNAASGYGGRMWNGCERCSMSRFRQRLWKAGRLVASAAVAYSAPSGDYAGRYAGRYSGVPSPAMRARHPGMSPSVLAFCCVLGDILYDIYTGAEKEDHRVCPPVPADTVVSRASSRTPHAASAKQQPSRRQRTRKPRR